MGWKRFALLVLITALFSYLGGLTAGWWIPAQAQARVRAAARTPETITAREFRVVDEAGFPRGFFRGEKTGTVFQMLGWNGPGLKIRVGRTDGRSGSSPNQAVIELGDAQEAAHIRIVINDQGGAGLFIRAASPMVPEGPGVIPAEAAATIFIQDHQGQILWRAPVTQRP
jgi:hypothetical protein